MVLPIIKFPGKSDSFICRGYNHMNYRFHLDSSHLSQWEISFCHFHQTKITFANMNKESNMLNYTADLYGHPRTLCLAQSCVLMEKTHGEYLISRMSFWVICTLIVIKTCYTLHSLCYQKLRLCLPRLLILLRPQNC